MLTLNQVAEDGALANGDLQNKRTTGKNIGFHNTHEY